ncbi:hypothetical protein ILUMI_02993 [Ignelater luminosus]|uniref:Uncharacterized protein n=1 Tax=Ignelater luminosus TaxID=2038154 RepID=A0A8K0DFH7_IGNLU|nr:hypothetical protein ILUMI_02993 [Ignelater luminosus]
MANENCTRNGAKKIKLVTESILSIKIKEECKRTNSPINHDKVFLADGSNIYMHDTCLSLREPRVLSPVRALSSCDPATSSSPARTRVLSPVRASDPTHQPRWPTIAAACHTAQVQALPNGNFICKLQPPTEQPGQRKRKKKNKRQRDRQAATQEVSQDTATDVTTDSPSPVPPQLARMESRPSSAASTRSYAEHGSRAHRRRRLRGSQPPPPEEPSPTVRGSTATGPYG